MSAMLSRESLLLALKALPSEDVTVSGGAVRVRGLSAKERDEYEASCWQGRGEKRDLNFKNLRAKLIVRSVVNEDGTRMFSDADVDLVGDLNAKDADALFSAAQRLSGLTKADVDELGKGSGDAP